MADNNEIWVFLSHSNKDYEKVIKVRDLLEKNSFRPLMFFLKCLNDDDEIDDLIKREIDSRGRFILCDSENARSSEWVRREVEYIKSKQRVYQIINIEDSEEVIASKILTFKKASNVYVSYSHADKFVYDEFAALLKNDWNFKINEYEKQVFAGIEYSRFLKTKINLALKEGYVIFLVTKNFMASPLCVEELKYAYSHRSKGNVVILKSDVDHDSIRNVIPDYNYYTTIPFTITDNGHLSVNMMKLYFTFMGELISERAKNGDELAQKWQLEYAEDFYENGKRLYYDDRPYEAIEKAAYCELRYAADLGHKKAKELLDWASWNIDTEKTWKEHQEYIKNNYR